MSPALFTGITKVGSLMISKLNEAKYSVKKKKESKCTVEKPDKHWFSQVRKVKNVKTC